MGRVSFAQVSQFDTIKPSTKVGGLIFTDKLLNGSFSVSNPSQDLLDKFNKINKDRVNKRRQKQELAKRQQIERQKIIELAQQRSQASITPEVTAKVYQSSCSDPKSCIYDKESGNNPNARNAGGCYGLGQDCNGVVERQCGASYACQDAYFTRYAMSRYGSWANAWAVWQSKGWW